jgi:hypothetical protein
MRLLFPGAFSLNIPGLSLKTFSTYKYTGYK